MSPASTMAASSAQCTHLAREEYGGESIWSEVWRLVGALQWRGRAMPLLPSYRSTGARYEHPMVMAVRMVALRRASLRWWWLPSRVVWATIGVAVISSDVPSLSEGQRPNQDHGIEHRGATLEDLMVARVSCRAKAPCFGTSDDDICGCSYLLEDVVVVLLSMLVSG